MNIHDFAKMLSGRQYGNEITDAECATAKVGTRVVYSVDALREWANQ